MKPLLALFAVICVVLVACAGASEPAEQAEQTLPPTAGPTDTPITEPTDTPVPIDTPVPTAAPTEKPKPTETPSPTPTDTPEPTAKPTPEPTATPTPKPGLVIEADSLNIRSGPGTVYDVVAAASQGEELEVVGEAYDCQWLNIETPGGKEGWVSGGSDIVTLNVDCGVVPESEIPPTPTPSAPVAVASGQTWRGIPLMPGASPVSEDGSNYYYMVQASADEVLNFYRTASINAGWSIVAEVPHEPGLLFGVLMIGREGCLANVTYESSSSGSPESVIWLLTTC